MYVLFYNWVFGLGFWVYFLLMASIIYLPQGWPTWAFPEKP